MTVMSAVEAILTNHGAHWNTTRQIVLALVAKAIMAETSLDHRLGLLDAAMHALDAAGHPAARAEIEPMLKQMVDGWIPQDRRGLMGASIL